MDELRTKAAGLGYTTTLKVLNAADFGVPQARERMILVGMRDGARFRHPDATTPATPATVREALAGLPPIGAPGNSQTCTAKITPAQRPVLRRSPWAGMLFNGQGRPLNLDAPAPTLPASMGGNRTPIIDQQQLDLGSVPWVPGYHAQLWAGGEIATTIPSRLRRLTVEEAAILQTFPADMPWYGTQSSRYRQIGNAVPPLLAHHVAKALAEQLNLRATDRVDVLDFLVKPDRESSAA